MCQAVLTWEALAKARQTKFSLGEESLTDFNLLSLKIGHPDEVFIKKFNKRQEGENGADWEWWFLNQGATLGIGFRVQAKVIDPTTNNSFKHLHYSNQDVPQAGLLCDSVPHGCIPLYCLFTYVTATTHFSNCPCRCSHWPCRYEERLHGCSLVDAYWVKRIIPKNDVNTLAPKMVPWHCLVCCRDSSGKAPDDLPSRALATWKERILVKTDSVREDTEPLNSIKQLEITNMPKYVRDMLGSETRGGGGSSERNDTEGPGPGVEGVVVIRQSKEG
jgi:hypothetical protein